MGNKIAIFLVFMFFATTVYLISKPQKTTTLNQAAFDNSFMAACVQSPEYKDYCQCALDYLKNTYTQQELMNPDRIMIDTATYNCLHEIP